MNLTGFLFRSLENLCKAFFGYVLSDAMEVNVTVMLAGSFLILKIFVNMLLLNGQLFLKGVKFTEKTEENFRVLAAIFYHTFLDIFKRLDTSDDNAEEIKLVDPPVVRTKPILFSKIYLKNLQGKNSSFEEGQIISGVPPKETYSHFFSDSRYKSFKKSLKKVMTNLAEQAIFQKDDEKMKLYKLRFELRKQVAQKLKKMYPDLSARYENYITQRKKDLYLL
jgi:hypothetical protein